MDALKDEKYPLLVADSTAIAMRGLDYRSYENSILLIVMKSFRHQREMVQAANRVGRGGDKCRRVIIGDIDLIDHMGSCLYKSALIKYLEAYKINQSPNMQIFSQNLKQVKKPSNQMKL